MRAADLLELLSPSLPLPAIEIDTLTENSAKAAHNAVFVCIKGARANGHHFAADAYARGCRLFVAEDALSLPDDACIFYVENTRKALATLACRLYRDPSHEMHLIGITGTKGKTTTAHLIRHILNRAGLPCGYIGTNGVMYNGVEHPLQNTTPDAVTLQGTLRKMLDAGVRTAVIEVSSQALMQSRADGTRFETVIFTNLYHDHVGTNEHPAFAHYRDCKHRLFTDFGARLAVCNADDPATAEMLSGTSADRVIACSAADVGDFCAKSVTPLRSAMMLGTSFTVTHNTERIACTLPLSGRMNVDNALFALATAKEAFGIPLRVAAEALQDASIAGRSEVIPLPNGACAVIDYAHNGESLSQLLSSLREYAPARLSVLFGSVGERSQLRRAELGSAAASLSDRAILTSDNPAREDPNVIIEEIAQAFEGTSTPYVAIPDRAEAIGYAVRTAIAGEILVLAGKGHEAYQLIGNEKIPFSEKEILQKLYAKGAESKAFN